MAVKDEKAKELWVGWTRDAISVYEEPDDIDPEDLIDDVVDFVTEYADAMVLELAHRFEDGTVRKRRGKGKSRRRSRLDEDDDDDDADD